jgi:hypothetical protein
MDTTTGQTILTGKPTKTYGGGKRRICDAPDCSVVISKYNAKEKCASCWNAIPVQERPYAYADGWSSLPKG